MSDIEADYRLKALAEDAHTRVESTAADEQVECLQPPDPPARAVWCPATCYRGPIDGWAFGTRNASLGYFKLGADAMGDAGATNPAAPALDSAGQASDQSDVSDDEDDVISVSSGSDVIDVIDILEEMEIVSDEPPN